MTSFEVAAFAPQWSPDDRFLAFSGIPSAATRVANVFVMGLEGGQLRQLTHDRDSDALVRSWSADGHSIYFHSSRGGEQRIWRLAIAGGAAVPVTNREAIDGRESADGKWFYFIGPSAKPGNLAASGPLWRAPVGGGPEERVLDGLSFFRWEVTPLSIYFVELSAAPGDPDLLKRFSFETGRISSVGSLQQRASRNWSGFSATPDGRSFLTVHDQPRTSDLYAAQKLSLTCRWIGAAVSAGGPYRRG
jgi:dipeptidyl aminopeptidase/acylaminoacyl peptidase